ncbi:MAG: hypothetical protein P0S93_00035 [Candidatus Neptunochlamydia sp.]|nr:hypothetical protein [Candidatus Neptunochlamydia sp.]
MVETALEVIDANLAVEAVNLGNAYDIHSTKKYQKINDEVLRLQDQLKSTILHLKTELSNIKAKNPDSEKFDISEHWDTILDFQEILNEMREKLGKEANPMFGKKEFKKSENVSKADLQKLIEQLGNAADDNKHQIHNQTNQLFTHANLALAMFDALNKVLRSVLQSQERRAQQVGKAY